MAVYDRAAPLIGPSGGPLVKPVYGYGPPSGRLYGKVPIYIDRRTNTWYGYRQGIWSQIDTITPGVALIQYVTQQLKNTETMSLPSNPVVGNKLVLLGAHRDTPAVYPTAGGFTAINLQGNSSAANAYTMYRDVVAGDGKDWSFNPGNHDSRMVLIEFSGLVAGAPYNSQVGTGSGTSYSTTSLSTTPTGIAVAAFSLNSGTGTVPVAGSGWTLIGDGIAEENVEPYGLHEYRLVLGTGGGSLAVAATSNSGPNWAGASAFFQGY